MIVLMNYKHEGTREWGTARFDMEILPRVGEYVYYKGDSHKVEIVHHEPQNNGEKKEPGRVTVHIYAYTVDMDTILFNF